MPSPLFRMPHSLNPVVSRIFRHVCEVCVYLCLKSVISCLRRIRTGWSTISNRDAHCSGLTSSEMKQIQQVLEKAQAMERMEEIRIGYVCCL